MKILILALPRTGTKLLQLSINRYLKSLGTTLSIPEKETGLDEFLEYHSTTAEYPVFTDTYNDSILLFSTQKTNNVDQEVKKRIELIKNTNYNCVVKHSPRFYNEKYKNLMLDILPIFDKIVVLKRLNSFDVALSVCLAKKTNLFLNNIHLKEIYSNKLAFILKNPVTVDLEMFENEYVLNENFVNDVFKEFYQNFNHIEITYDQLFNLKTSQDFCKILDVDHTDFVLNDFFEKEFSSFNKLEFVKNSKEVLDLAVELKNFKF